MGKLVNTDDFLRQFLVDNKHAAPGKVAINGGSNGGNCLILKLFRATLPIDFLKRYILSFQGLLVAACVNRAPEGLIGAAVAEAGVLDLLKVRIYFIFYFCFFWSMFFVSC